MRPYLAILSARFRTLLQYRAAAAAGFGTQLFWGLIRMMIFQAFYEASPAAAPMSLDHVVAYVWLGQAFLLLLPFRVDADIQDMIRTGGVAYELLRPVDLYFLWYGRGVANRVAPVVLRAVPMLIIAAAVGWIQIPDLARLGAFGAALVCAFLLSTALAVLLDISMFWTISGRGVAMVVMPAVFLLSGMIVPLPIFPEFLQPLLRSLPFRGLCDLPFRLFTGHIPPGDVGWVVLQQLVWTVVLVLAGRWLLSRAMRRVVVQGG
jgi:viologen exporter family transport system permease protein